MKTRKILLKDIELKVDGSGWWAVCVAGYILGRQFYSKREAEERRRDFVKNLREKYRIIKDEE